MADNDSEIDVKIAGQEVRAKGYRLVDLIWLPMVFGIAYTCLTLYNHEAGAQTSVDKVAIVLKESNVAIAKVLKESSDQNADAVKQMAVEQRRQTNVLQEMSCLLDPAMKNRGDAREFCKRIIRGDNR